MEIIFILVTNLVQSWANQVRALEPTWVHDDSMEGGHFVHSPGEKLWGLRPSQTNSIYGKMLNVYGRELNIPGRYVPCDYSCGKFLFLSYAAEDSGTHRFLTDAFGCSACEQEAYRKEFGDTSPWDEPAWDDEEVEF